MLPELRTIIPGPQSLALAERLAKVESRNVTYLSPDFPVFWDRAEGVNVWDVDGNRFLDFTSAFAVAGLGHRAPAVVEALVEQAGKLVHGMGDVHPTELKVRLCEVLSEITFERWGKGWGKTILCNSGFEAIEAALKTSFMKTGKRGVISFSGGYHGLGFGALEVCGLPYFRSPFLEQLAQFGSVLPYPDRLSYSSEAMFRLLEETCVQRPIGAVLVEPIQGRGGDVVPPNGFLQDLREFCTAKGLLLIFDEIYTGFNRSGELFASDLFEVFPDLLCLGKGLTSGFPLSACVGSAAVMDAWPVSSGEALHTSTFLGSPLGCSMALASIAEHLKPTTRAQVRSLGGLFSKQLQTLAQFWSVREVRGSGLMWGVELVTAAGEPNGKLAGELIVGCLREGILVLAGSPHGNVLSLVPPFFVSTEECEFVVEVLTRQLAVKQI